MRPPRPVPFAALPPAPPPAGVRALVLDTETTGLDAAADRVLEVAVVESWGDVDVGCWSTLVRVDGGVPTRVTELTGITTAMVAAGVDEAVAVAALTALLERVEVVVAWNAPFDRAFVAALFGRCGCALPPTPWVCALEAARARRPDLKGYRLDLVARDLGIATGRSHRALDDARCALSVWRALPVAPPSAGQGVEPAAKDAAAKDAAPATADAAGSPTQGPRGTLDLFR
ncbi:MAG: 3'-5' exonuclease [Deltaproteobacteria bacterium]|nr:3'-5' exonuclease [Deltaproteobacteria bacterium]